MVIFVIISMFFIKLPKSAEQRLNMVEHLLFILDGIAVSDYT